MNEEELRRRTNPVIVVLERRKEEKEWNSAEVMRILRKRAAKRIAAETAATCESLAPPEPPSGRPPSR